MKSCNTCIWWNGYENNFGFCGQIQLDDQLFKAGDAVLTDPGGLDTHKFFGCTLHYQSAKS